MKTQIKDLVSGRDYMYRNPSAKKYDGMNGDIKPTPYNERVKLMRQVIRENPDEMYVDIDFGSMNICLRLKAFRSECGNNLLSWISDILFDDIADGINKYFGLSYRGDFVYRIRLHNDGCPQFVRFERKTHNERDAIVFDEDYITIK